MSRISIPRLRRFVAQREGTHAAMLRANASYRDAREGLARASDALRLYDETDGQRSAAHTGNRGPQIDYRARYVADVRTAQAAVEAAEAAQESASEAWNHAGALGSAAIEYARNTGQLPADLEDR